MARSTPARTDCAAWPGSWGRALSAGAPPRADHHQAPPGRLGHGRRVDPGLGRTQGSRLGRLPWVQDNLRPAFFPGIEVLVSFGCLVEGQVVGNDPGRLDLAFGDEAAQIPVVVLHRALPGAHVLALEPEA